MRQTALRRIQDEYAQALQEAKERAQKRQVEAENRTKNDGEWLENWASGNERDSNQVASGALEGGDSWDDRTIEEQNKKKKLQQLAHAVQEAENEDDEWEPSLEDWEELVDDLEIRTIACGNQHTVILLHDGRVFSCGKSDSGQLGHGDEHASNVLVPTQVCGIAKEDGVCQVRECTSCANNFLPEALIVGCS